MAVDLTRWAFGDTGDLGREIAVRLADDADTPVAVFEVEDYESCRPRGLQFVGPDDAEIATLLWCSILVDDQTLTALAAELFAALELHTDLCESAGENDDDED